MKLILIGAIGAGKGTQAKKISTKYGIPHISTGDILRAHIKNKTEIGMKVRAVLDSGGLVSDDIITEIVKIRVLEDDCSNGFILDGFPRTISQAKDLESITNIDKAIYLKVDDSIIIKRLAGRRTCNECTAMYNVEYLKPKTEGICDVCGGELIQRKDDNEEIVKDRLKVFYDVTAPIIDFYREKGLIFEVDGMVEVEKVSQTITEALEG